jgi:hypothetical protein
MRLPRDRAARTQQIRRPRDISKAVPLSLTRASRLKAAGPIPLSAETSKGRRGTSSPHRGSLGRAAIRLPLAARFPQPYIRLIRLAQKGRGGCVARKTRNADGLAIKYPDHACTAETNRPV